MPRYKVVCVCKTVFWVKKAHKLDEYAKKALQGRGRSICPECTDICKLRVKMVKGEIPFEPMPHERTDVARLIDQVATNKEHGFTCMPFRDRFLEIVASDRRAVSEGIKTRYRGFSPTWEMLRCRHRLLAAAYIWEKAGMGELPA